MKKKHHKISYGNLTAENTVPPGSEPAHSVLIVDDNRDLLAFLQEQLQSEGYSVTVIDNGRDAIAWIRNNDVDLMLIDYQLADTTGEAVINAISNYGKSIPFIVITGYGDIQVAVELMRRGALDYLVKDFKFMQMMPAVVDQAFNRLEQKKRLAQAEKDIKEAERRYRILYENSTFGYVRLDATGGFKEFNRAFREMLGYSESELIQLSSYDITPEKWHSLDEQIIRHSIIQNGESEPYRKEYIRKDGSLISVNIRAYLISDEQGKPSGIWKMVSVDPAG